MKFFSQLFKKKKSTESKDVELISNSEETIVYEPGSLVYVMIRSEHHNYDSQTIKEIISHFLGDIPVSQNNIYLENYIGSSWDQDRESWDNTYVENWIKELMSDHKIPEFDLGKFEIKSNSLARDYLIDKGLLVVGLIAAASVK